MAVLKAKPEKVISSFIPVLEQNLISPHVVTTLSGDVFANAAGDQVILELPKLATRAREYEWRTRTSPIQFDDISGGQQLVVELDTHIYTGTILTDEHYTLDDVDFAKEVVLPQVESIAADYEARTVAALRSVDAKHEVSFDASDDPYIAVLEANRRLNKEKVAPISGRTVLVGENIAAAWLASDRLSKYESTGETGTPALRNAIIGKLGNIPVIQVPELGGNEGYLQHKSSIVLSSVAPAIPRGVIAGARKDRNGFGIRWIADYDANYLRDRSIVSSFLGVNEIKDERWQSNGYHNSTTGLPGSPGAGMVAHEAGDIKPDAVVKNVRIVPLTLTGFDEDDGLLA